ncbi:UDP-phosphate alpha N-acetylglucosaminyltransferase [Pseudorhizobium endolithicum]|uniref:UDP-phosphate alpha N-acetylglucosaminyltransferase n=1 Tax=Pseudorhizobium endolithicum TaxID=1191678 RepID=A0ABN7JRF8_9HYPH|nr:MraY family glycosyltransferase [Pseudorhizobium endolithicum]CAD7044345.1 UDP-phosphate alpha N-acetylglucosaminyltransferase [Pseudorhizobium endolithicum]
MAWLIIHTLATFSLVVSIILVLRRLSAKLELIDRPDGIRKQHRGQVPLCGGIAIVAAFALTTFLTDRATNFAPAFWIALTSLAVLGVADDRRPLPALFRFFVQLAVAVLLVASVPVDPLLLDLPFVESAFGLLPLISLVGTLFIVGLVNAWNMMDGVDGLAGGAAAVALVWLLLVAAHTDAMAIAEAMETLLICICGFLVFNMRSPWRIRASVFLGDAGSMALGLAIAYVILALATGSSPVSFIALLCIVVVPITDTLSLIIRRLHASRSPMSADRWHLHHLLIDHGMSSASTTWTILLISAFCGAIGYAGIRFRVADELLTLVLLTIMAVHTVFVLLATGRLRRPLRGSGVGTGLRARRLEVVNIPPAVSALDRSGSADVDA